jgi:hypothetical protein
MSSLEIQSATFIDLTGIVFSASLLLRSRKGVYRFVAVPARSRNRSELQGPMTVQKKGNYPPKDCQVLETEIDVLGKAQIISYVFASPISTHGSLFKCLR